MLYCPNFFWNVLQVWMTGKDVYLQMTWSWPDKTWNILCSYCLQWNTSQSKFRNHYFLFLFAFSILSQLFLIWGCMCFPLILFQSSAVNLCCLHLEDLSQNRHIQYVQLLCVCVPECPWETKMKEKAILAKGNVMDGHVTEQLFGL